jgi:bifunctional non-homologous end joining protein LigD
VIGGYTVGGVTFDALVFGYYDGGNLIYAARTRNGFTPKLRAELLKKFKPLETKECPFSNLPEKKAGRWGAGLTAAKMEECRWRRPVLVGQFEFVEWTQDAEAASHYTRSSNRTTNVSDHPSLSPAHGS